jgi:hypothetical protein
MKERMSYRIRRPGTCCGLGGLDNNLGRGGRRSGRRGGRRHSRPVPSAQRRANARRGRSPHSRPYRGGFFPRRIFRTYDPIFIPYNPYVFPMFESPPYSPSPIVVQQDNSEEVSQLKKKLRDKDKKLKEVIKSINNNKTLSNKQKEEIIKNLKEEKKSVESGLGNLEYFYPSTLFEKISRYIFG